MRKRNPRNEGLPPRCEYLPSGSVRYKPAGAKTQILGTKHNTLKEIHEAYQRINDAFVGDSLGAMAELWYQSHNFLTLKPRTQHDYKVECSKRPIQAFKGWDVSEIEPANIYEYMQLRSKESIRRANLELVWIRHVLGFAVTQGAVDVNVCRDIKPLREHHKRPKPYVSDYNYRCMFAKASQSTRVAMEISYCTGIRLGDVLKLRWDDIDEKMSITEGKTGHTYNKLISTRLRKALEAAKRLPGHPFGGCVVRASKGGQYTVSGFQANWKRAKYKLPAHRQFTFHQIRKKAITDSQGDKQKFSMHSDARMLGVYDLEIPTSPSH